MCTPQIHQGGPREHESTTAHPIITAIASVKCLALQNNATSDSTATWFHDPSILDQLAERIANMGYVHVADARCLRCREIWRAGGRVAKKLGNLSSSEHVQMLPACVHAQTLAPRPFHARNVRTHVKAYSWACLSVYVSAYLCEYAHVCAARRDRVLVCVRASVRAGGAAEGGILRRCAGMGNACLTHRRFVTPFVPVASPVWNGFASDFGPCSRDIPFNGAEVRHALVIGIVIRSTGGKSQKGARLCTTPPTSAREPSAWTSQLARTWARQRYSRWTKGRNPEESGGD